VGEQTEHPPLDPRVLPMIEAVIRYFRSLLDSPAFTSTPQSLALLLHLLDPLLDVFHDLVD
jgi:hypothetical protein